MSHQLCGINIIIKATTREIIMQLTLPYLVMITAALLIAHSIIWA
jgi:hypothetical protein